MNRDEQLDDVVPNETTKLPRRSFLKLAGAGLAPFGINGIANALTPAQVADHGARLITRQREPENLESPFDALDGPITPTDLFYVRTHFATPHLSAADWKLQIEGSVAKPFTLTYDQLKALPSHKVTATLECAGNSRVYLTPPARGVQWEQGAVSTAEWTGVRLADILAAAGLNPDAVEVVLEGSDSGEIKDPPRPGAALSFSRSLPLKKAMQDNVLIAYEMNGQPLPVSHGFPVRAIVPGWYAVASVKWLKRLHIVTKPYSGYFQTIDYAYWQHENGFPVRVPLTSLLVKSQISKPSFKESVKASSTVKVKGAAWAGEGGITKVEVSDDGGKSWNAAKLTTPAVEGAWQLWEFEWKTPAKARHVSLMSRATDAAGNTQPMTRDLDRENYMINQVIPIEVDVR